MCDGKSAIDEDLATSIYDLVIVYRETCRVAELALYPTSNSRMLTVVVAKYVMQ